MLIQPGPSARREQTAEARPASCSRSPPAFSRYPGCLGEAAHFPMRVKRGPPASQERQSQDSIDSRFLPGQASGLAARERHCRPERGQPVPALSQAEAEPGPSPVRLQKVRSQESPVALQKEQFSGQTVPIPCQAGCVTLGWLHWFSDASDLICGGRCQGDQKQTRTGRHRGWLACSRGRAMKGSSHFSASYMFAPEASLARRPLLVLSAT